MIFLKEELMKKINLLLLALPLTLVACGGASDTTPATDENGNKIPTTTAEKAEAASKMTDAELLAEAKKENGMFVAYGNTSRITKAMENFITKYGADLGLTADNAKASKLGDTQIYSLLQSEYASKDNSKGASFVLVQDSATLDLYRANTEMLTNYHSNVFDSHLDQDELVPLTHQYINKLFMWNNVDGENAPKFTNVWELTEEKFKGKVFFKAPNSEQVNMNFLITLTSDAWVEKMATAYKTYYGRDYVKSADYKTASHEWIAKFLANANFSITSDTTIAATLSNEENKDKAGLFVLSKLRDSSVTSENLSVGAWQPESITPFAGFMYSIYAQLATKGPRPYTAMLFTNYLMSEEGFAPWATSVGGYSSNKDIPVYEGDKSLEFYKNCLVVEDGAYINTVKADTQDWINGLLATDKE